MGLLLLEQVDPHLAHPLHHHSGGAHSEASHRQAAHPIGHMALLSVRNSVAAHPIGHMALLSVRNSVAAHPIGQLALLSLRNSVAAHPIGHMGVKAGQARRRIQPGWLWVFKHAKHIFF